ARKLHVTGDGPELRTTALLGSEFLISLAAHLDDVRNGGERLDVVDDRRRRIQTGNGREGRLHARVTTQTFERAEQRRLFTADVRARAGMRVNLAGEVSAEDLVADESCFSRFLERNVHDVDQI